MAADVVRGFWAMSAVVFTLGGVLAQMPAQAQSWPVKPIRMVLTISGGGETNARVVMDRVSQALGHPIVVDAQSGAGGAVGATQVARSSPDGYTLLYGTNSAMTLRRFLIKDMPYDTLKDFVPLARIGEATSAIAATNSLPVSTIGELIEYAKKNPGKINYGTPGIGTTHHLSGVLIEQMTGIKMVHVPYKNAPQSVTDLVAGRVDVVFTTLSSFLPFSDGGKLKVIGINGGQRFDKLPNVPTVVDVLPGFERPRSWIGTFAPTGTPAAVVRRMSDEIVKAAGSPDIKAKVGSLGTLADPASSEEFAAFLKADYESVGRLMKAAGIQPE
ncbi:MAG: Bug family tripartite tricarboxylate transporter substrate binding protein [Burkholderiales bacterium]